MSDERILAELGSRFTVRADARVWWAVRADLAARIAATGFGPEGDGDLHPSGLVGRKPLAELRTPEGAFVVRRFTHGGLWRFATGRRFSDPARPFREILCADHLARNQVACAETVAARARRMPGAGWELALVTRRVEDALDLGELMGRVRRGEIRPQVLRACVVALGELIQRLHACGFFHADLTPNNVLVNSGVLEGAVPVLTLLDLDRARVLDHWSDEDRRDNLRRLYRFVVRREERDGRSLRRTDYARFCAAYCADKTARHLDWRAIERDHTRASAWHGFGWLLEHTFGKGRDVRERVRTP